MSIVTDRTEELLSLASYYRSSPEFSKLYGISVVRGGSYPSIVVSNKKEDKVELVYNTSEMGVLEIKKSLSRRYGKLVIDIPLPPKEEAFYSLVKSYYDKKGIFPPYTYIKKRMGWKTDHTVTEYRKRLQNKAYIEKKSGRYIPVK